MKRACVGFGVFLVLCGWPTVEGWAAEQGVVKVAVDLTEAPRRILHAHLSLPVSPGPLTLYYPKWIPGEHAPNGPITDVAGLKLEAGGKTLAWRRDAIDMFAFRCQVPEGASTLNVALDFLEPPLQTTGFTSAASTTDKLAVLSWNQVVLYPKGADIHKIQYEASARLPAGWKFGTALQVKDHEQNTVEFKPVALARLIDSPLLTGQYFKEVRIGPSEGTPHFVELAADSPQDLKMSDEVKAHFDQLVAQTGILFGTRHYRSYRFLITLSDHVAHFGEEHHESTDIRLPEKWLTDPATLKAGSSVVAHEFVHSWNGKYRRPAGLITKDYQDPERTGLLWVYEGLTEYLGTVLTARAGFWTPETTREYLATVVQQQENQRGRSWRPLEDTAVAAQLLYAARPDWAAWRRSTDFYDEGTLLWLDVDTLIRKQSGGKKSLDDFCKAFHGGTGGRPETVPYTFDDVVQALNAVTPYDWKGLLTKRVTETASHAPLDGLHRGGWRLTYGEKPTDFASATAGVGKIVDLTASVGLMLNDEGMVVDLIPGTAADKAGLGPGMKIVGVNGRNWTADGMRDAVQATQRSKQPLTILVNNVEYLHTHKLDYHGGAKYPRLSREPKETDLLDAILKKRAG